MGTAITKELVDRAIEFHGHSCPGLAIGIRAAEYVSMEFSDITAADLLCVSETDMCGVDGIQFLTGCTLGKGNLIHRDYGKMAFSFYNKKDGTAIRLLYTYEAKAKDRLDLIYEIMETDLNRLFSRTVIDSDPPRSARVLTGLCCEDCGEKTMESRTRRFEGKTLCIPCFGQVDQKL